MNEIDERKLLRLSQIADGIDPDSTQSLNEFMQFKSIIERTILPTRRDVAQIDYVNYAGRVFYPDREDNPFTLDAKSRSEAWMAYKGQKSNQFVELMRRNPAILTDLQTMTGATQKRGMLDRLLGRESEE